MEYRTLQALLDSIPSHSKSFDKCITGEDVDTHGMHISRNPATLSEEYANIPTLPDHTPWKASAIVFVAYFNSHAPGDISYMYHTGSRYFMENIDSSTEIIGSGDILRSP